MSSSFGVYTVETGSTFERYPEVGGRGVNLVGGRGRGGSAPPRHEAASTSSPAGKGSMPTQRRTTVWADAGGRTTAHLLTTSAGAAAVETAIAAQSNAGVLLSWEGPLTASVPAPVAATFPDVSDLAVLTFQTAAGTL